MRPVYEQTPGHSGVARALALQPLLLIGRFPCCRSSGEHIGRFDDDQDYVAGRRLGCRAFRRDGRDAQVHHDSTTVQSHERMTTDQYHRDRTDMNDRNRDTGDMRDRDRDMRDRDRDRDRHHGWQRGTITAGAIA